MWWDLSSTFCEHIRCQEVGWVTSDRQTPQPFLNKCLLAWGQGKKKQEAPLQLSEPRWGQPAGVPGVKSSSDLWLHPLPNPQASWGLPGRSRCLQMQPISLSRSLGISWQLAHMPGLVISMPSVSLPTPMHPFTNPFPRLRAQNQKVPIRSLWKSSPRRASDLSPGSLTPETLLFAIPLIASNIRQETHKSRVLFQQVTQNSPPVLFSVGSPMCLGPAIALEDLWVQSSRGVKGIRWKQCHHLNTPSIMGDPGEREMITLLRKQCLLDCSQFTLPFAS